VLNPYDTFESETLALKLILDSAKITGIHPYKLNTPHKGNRGVDMSAWLEEHGMRHHHFGLLRKSILRFAVVATMFAGTISVFLFSSNQLPAQPSLSNGQPVNPQDLMWWLPADTESVVSASGPFLIPTGSRETSNENAPGWLTKKATQAEIRAAFEALPLEVFYDLDLTETLKGVPVAYAMQGSRHFREPQGDSEVMEFEGCSILVFERDLGPLINAIQQSVTKSGARSETIGGIRVLTDQEKSAGAVETRLLAVPRPNVLLVANNRQYLVEILARMAKRKALRAFPGQLPEWQFLDINARFWGLRHYDPTQAKLDPTSPFGKDRTSDTGDPKAIGLLFALAPKNEQSLVIMFLTGDEAKARAEASPGKAVAEPQEGVSFEVKLQNPKPGVLEQIYMLDRSTTLDYSILAIESALGRGMYF
jgi:hypothetical protein